MTFTLLSWILAVWLVALCLSVAVPVWKRAGQQSGPSRRSLLAGLMEAEFIAGLLRLMSPWTSGSVVLWVVAVVALAAAVAGAVLRWPELPGRVPKSEAEAQGVASGTSTAPEDVELVPKPDVAVSEVSELSRRPQGAAMEAAPVERSRRPFLPMRERAAAVDTGKPGGKAAAGKPGRKAKIGKKKKEPGNLALAGNAALLLAVVMVSFLAG